jgi:hypothetical protein
VTRRRPAQPTSNALRRRKADVNLAFRAPALPAARDFGEHGDDLRRVAARENLTFPVDQARREMLRTIERLAPKALMSLALVDRSDEDGIAAWAQRYRIDAPWVRIAAANTLDLWKHWKIGRGRRFDLNLTNTGARVPSAGRLPKRPPELLIRADHLEWLVRSHVRSEPFRQIHTPRQTAEKAVRTLARVLGLSENSRNLQ